MSETLDREAQEAIDDLATQLAPALTQVIEDAVRDAIGRIDVTLKARRGEIDAASDRVSELLKDLSDEMRARAVAALTEGIHNQVIPAIAVESRKIVAQTEEVLTPRLKGVENAAALSVRNAQTALQSAIDHILSATTGALADLRRTLTDSIEKDARESAASLSRLRSQVEQAGAGTDAQLRQLAADGERARGVVLAEGESRHQALTSQVRTVADRIGREGQEAAAKLADAVERSAQRAQRGLDGLSDRLSARQEEAARQLQQLDQRQAERHDAIVELLADATAAQRRDARRIVIAQLAGVAIVLAVLIALLVSQN